MLRCALCSVKSTAEIEEEMMAHMPKIKAVPLNPEVSPVVMQPCIPFMLLASFVPCTAHVCYPPLPICGTCAPHLLYPALPLCGTLHVLGEVAAVAPTCCKLDEGTREQTSPCSFPCAAPCSVIWFVPCLSTPDLLPG